jgi:uncharacterized protein YmfQ (DUF2313 family)
MIADPLANLSAGSPVAGGNPWARLGPADFAANVQALLPPGDAFGGPGAADLCAGIGAAFAELHARLYQLSEVELWPDTTNACLPDWEFDYGLPDCCTPLAPTLAGRRAALAAKIASRGGQSKAYFIAVAAALGFTITITEGAASTFTWTVHVSGAFTPILFRAGNSGAGDLLTAYRPNAELECVLNQIKPAHTILNFAYGS